MKRGNPPVRRTPLKRGKQLERKAPLRSSSNLERHAPLAKQSKKRQAENRQRRAMKNAMFPDGRPACVVPWCDQWADDLHEPLTRARVGSIVEPDNAVPTCRGHNQELTEEPAWGYKLHLLVHSWDKRTYAQIAEDRRNAIAAWHAEHSWEAAS